ncbi:hypothetical protein [Sphingorhabdus sp.]|uniref:hypothetical protein n=1 Tax=Sphingorhabdus sp. TaxID=1902408 RepID=UPI00359363FA
MYDFIDQRVTTLDRGGQFLVWSLRNWVLAIQNRQCPPNAIGPAFAKWGMIGALPHFHMAMMILSKEGLNTLQFSPVGCLQISDDEAMMLSLFRSLRDDMPDQVRAMTELLVAEGFAAPLFAALTAVSMRLAESNLIPEAPQRSRLPTSTPEK